MTMENQDCLKFVRVGADIWSTLVWIIRRIPEPELGSWKRYQQSVDRGQDETAGKFGPKKGDIEWVHYNEYLEYHIGDIE